MKALLTLCRPLNCLMAAAASMLGSWLTIHQLDVLEVWVASLVVAFVTAGGNELNDLCDIQADRINHPDRPLVTGSVSKSHAVGLLSLCWGIASLIGACFLDGVTAALVLVAMLLLALYSAILSRLPLIGNVVIGVLAAMSIFCGFAVVSDREQIGESDLLFLAAGLAFFVHLSRECIKSAEDIEGDRVQGRNTVATIFGRNATVLFSVPILLLGVSLSCEFVHLTWEGGALYLSLIYIPAVVISCLIIWQLLRGAEMNLRLASLGLKIYLAYGLILILLMDFAQVPVYVVLP